MACGLYVIVYFYSILQQPFYTSQPPCGQSFAETNARTLITAFFLLLPIKPQKILPIEKQ
jgi:hypothetical protein